VETNGFTIAHQALKEPTFKPQLMTAMLKQTCLTTTNVSHAGTNILTTTHYSHVETNVFTIAHASHAGTTTHVSHTGTNILDHNTFQSGGNKLF
jgi:hypothetical protein